MTSSDLQEKIRRGRAAALEFLPILQKHFASPNGQGHPGTILAAAAWLTGTSLYCSFHFKEEPPAGTIIKSEEANREWESLMYLLEQYNLGRTDVPVGRLMLAGMAAPDSFRPRVDMLQVQRGLEAQYHAVMKKHGFDYPDGAKVGIIHCSILIRQYSKAE